MLKTLDLENSNMLTIESFVEQVITAKNLGIGFVVLDKSGIKLSRAIKEELIELNKQYNQKISHLILKNGLKNTRFAKTKIYKESYGDK